MDSKTVLSPEDVAQTAVSLGSVDPTASESVERVVRFAEQDLGLDPESIKGSRVFIVTELDDDSGSMRGHEPAVQRAHSHMLSELRAASKEGGLPTVVSVTLMNKGLIQPYCPVNECLELTSENYVCDGNTPFLRRTESVLGTLLAKIAEFGQTGRTAQTFNIFMSDGAADDRNDEELKARLREVITGMTMAKQHIVCGVAIGSAEAKRLFAEIGIAKNWILDPGDSFAFEQAMQKVSRASRSASKGGAAFERTANEGFR